MTELGAWLTAELTAELAKPASQRLDYAQAKLSSETIDAHLGFRQAETEERLERAHKLSATARPKQTWLGLPLQSMQTPYAELVEMIAELKPQPGELWIDLGAAYGRLGLALGALAPKTRFIGYELVRERVDEGNRILKLAGFANAQLVTQDLADEGFVLAAADCYFVYDYGTREDVERTLEDLKRIARTRAITCVARGRGSRHWIERGHPWLAEVVPPRHCGNYSIYRS